MWREMFLAVVLIGGGFCPVGEVWAEDAPKEVMPNAQATFNEVKGLIESEYVTDISEDELWQGATEGMLGRLLQMEGHPTNHLLTPGEMNQLREGMKGEITGIGVLIQDISGALVITRALEGGGAEAAGLQTDDRILAIDGAPIKGMSLADVAGRIRGPVDTEVSLLVQRDTDEWTVKVRRSKVTVPYVAGEMVDGDVGLVAISSFSERAADDVSAQVAALKAQGMKRLILDVRRCPGGLMESAVDVSSLFLPKGAPIMSVEWAGQSKRDERVTKKAGPFADLPVVVLMDHQSASGAEILAAALSGNDRALLLGERSFGKGTVEKIFELENAWALKLSVAWFYGPDGASWMGEGLTPDIPLTPVESPQRLAVADDPMVHAARSVLRVSR